MTAKAKKKNRTRGGKAALLAGEIKAFASIAARAALAEDIGLGDVTTELIVGIGKRRLASIKAKESLVVAGHVVAKAAFTELDPRATYRILVKDGERAKRGEVIATVRARLDAVLTAERVALNFLQRLSGIATLSNNFVKKAARYRVTILDTRKTTPCMRVLERSATRAGGAKNHRFGLFDAVLIKDNHIVAAGSLGEAVERVRSALDEGSLIEVEASTLSEVRDAVDFGADIILLDNMTIARLKKSVALIEGRAVTEASGGINIDNVGEVAATGVDFISVGAITHSARAVDISLTVEP